MTENLDTDPDALFGDAPDAEQGQKGIEPGSGTFPTLPKGTVTAPQSGGGIAQAQLSTSATAVEEKHDEAFEDLEERVVTGGFDAEIQDSIKMGTKKREQRTQEGLLYRVGEYVRDREAQLVRDLQREDLLKRIGGYRALIQAGRTHTIPTGALDTEISFCQQHMAARSEELKSIDASVAKLDGSITKYRQQRAKLVAECDQANGLYRAKKREVERLGRDVATLVDDLKKLDPSDRVYQQKRDQRVDAEATIESERGELYRLHNRASNNGALVRRYGTVVKRLEGRRFAIVDDRLKCEAEIKRAQMDIDELESIKTIVATGIVSREETIAQGARDRGRTERLTDLLDGVIISGMQVGNAAVASATAKGQQKPDPYEQAQAGRNAVLPDDLTSLYM